MTRIVGLAGSMRRNGEAFVIIEAAELAALKASGSPGFGADVQNATQGVPVGRLILVHDFEDPDHRWLAAGAEAAIGTIRVGDRLELGGLGGQAIAAIVVRAWRL